MYALHDGCMRTAFCLAAAAAVIVLCCATPFDTLARNYLATAYVLENLLLELGAPVLLVLSLPKPLAQRVRIPLAVGWIAGMVVLALWYAPALLAAAVRSAPVHTVQVLSWIVGGMLFYLPVYSPAPQSRVRPVPHGVVYFLTALVFSSLLSLFIGFSRFGLYTPFLDARDTLHILDQLRGRWGLSPEMDEQTACLFMWVLSLFVWMSSVMVMFWRMYRESKRAARVSQS
jgi:cytochrome c oxidase assembly factor CtaG